MPTFSFTRDFALLFLSLFMVANASAENEIDNNTAIKSAATAKLIIYRKHSSPPLAYKPLISINDKQAFYLPRGQYGEAELSPGKYSVKSDWKRGSGVGDKVVNLELKANTVTYINASSSMATAFTGSLLIPLPSNNKLAKTEKAPDLTNLSPIYKWFPGWPKHNDPKEKENLNTRYNLRYDEERFYIDYKKASLNEKYELFRFVLHHHFVDSSFTAVTREVLLENLEQQAFNKQEFYILKRSIKLLTQELSDENRDVLIRVFEESQNKDMRKTARKYANKFYGLSLGKTK